MTTIVSRLELYHLIIAHVVYNDTQAFKTLRDEMPLCKKFHEMIEQNKKNQIGTNVQSLVQKTRAIVEPPIFVNLNKAPYDEFVEECRRFCGTFGRRLGEELKLAVRPDDVCDKEEEKGTCEELQTQRCLGGAFDGETRDTNVAKILSTSLQECTGKNAPISADCKFGSILGCMESKVQVLANDGNSQGEYAATKIPKLRKDDGRSTGLEWKRELQEDPGPIISQYLSNSEHDLLKYNHAPFANWLWGWDDDWTIKENTRIRPTFQTYSSCLKSNMFGCIKQMSGLVSFEEETDMHLVGVITMTVLKRATAATSLSKTTLPKRGSLARGSSNSKRKRWNTKCGYCDDVVALAPIMYDKDIPHQESI